MESYARTNLGNGMPIRILIIALAAVVAFACGSSKPMPDALVSFCGHPGDTGNDQGVGAFCNQLNDCSSTPSAHLCATIGDPGAHFCTKTCTMGGSAGQCGMMASCQCQGGQCGCFPDSCAGSGP